MDAAVPIDAALDSSALFGPLFASESWDGWRAILRGAFALPMTKADVATFGELVERDPPATRVGEL